MRYRASRYMSALRCAIASLLERETHNLPPCDFSATLQTYSCLLPVCLQAARESPRSDAYRLHTRFARTRGKNRKRYGGSPAHKPGFTFSGRLPTRLAAIRRGPKPSPDHANRLHAALDADQTEKEEAPTGGRGFFGSSGERCDGREAVTRLLHSTWDIENNPPKHEHFVMS